MMATLTEAQLFAQCTPDVQPAALPTVSARVACPQTGGIKRVRLAMDPVSGRPAVVWCGRYAARTMTCAQECLRAEEGEPDG